MTLQALADAFTRQDEEEDNFGAETDLYVTSWRQLASERDEGDDEDKGRGRGRGRGKDKDKDKDEDDEDEGEDDDKHKRKYRWVHRNRHTFVRFDLSSIPEDATVDEATLRLYLEEAPGERRDYRARPARDSWEEDEITWEDEPRTLGNSDTVSVAQDQTGWVEWDVTKNVERMLEERLDNNGWRIADRKKNSGVRMEGRFHAREHEGDLGPRLVIRLEKD